MNASVSLSADPHGATLLGVMSLDAMPLDAMRSGVFPMAGRSERGAEPGSTARRETEDTPTGEDTARRLRWLALLLAMPEAGSLEGLRGLAEEAPWLTGAGALAEVAGLSLEHWQAEYTRLFISGYPRTPCPPFESAYRHGQMAGPAAAELQDLYRRAGLTATAAPADYLGTELECAAYLTELAQDREEGGDPVAALLRELWDEHLNRWLARFAGDLWGHARLSLYRDLGTRLAALCPVPVDDA